MDDVSRCPDRMHLEKALLGLLPEAESEPVERHVLTCVRCAARGRSIAPPQDDPVGTALYALTAQDVGDTSTALPEGLRARLLGLASDGNTALEATQIQGGDTPPSGVSPVPPRVREKTFRFLSPPAAPDELGRLGGYRIQRLLGRGGMGVVFQAEDVRLRRQVALKVIRPDVMDDGTIAERFLREARALAAVEHQHVVPLYHVGEDRGIPFAVMPLLRGETLAARLARDGKLPAAEALRIGRAVARGLEAAHARGIIHRDIKPANIWLDGDEGDVKVLDFGLARPAGDGPSLTEVGTFAGTPSYMSPEQALGGPIDHRSDLFSLGSVLYTICTGSPPFRGDSPLATMRRVIDEPPRDLREVNPELPAPVVEIIKRLLAKQPGDRYQTAAEAAAALDEALADFSSRGGDSAPRVSDRGTATPAGRSGLGITRRNRTLAVGFAGAAAALAGIVITVVGRDGTRIEVTAPADSRIEIRVDEASPAARGNLHDSEPGRPGNAPPRAMAPFDARAARAHQQAWADDLGMPVEYTNSIGMQFVLIPPGEFLMGAPQEEIDEAIGQLTEDSFPLWRGGFRSEGPLHRVILTQPYYLAVHEVTQAQYRAVMGTNPSYFSAEGGAADVVDGLDTGHHPVEMVSWHDAAEFCNRLSRREGLEPSYAAEGAGMEVVWAGVGYRLPTEAEWEFACRAGTQTRYSSGNTAADLAEIGWYDDNANRRTHPVGQLRANPFGLFDTHGNVWEWCQDWMSPGDYESFKDRAAVDPSGWDHGKWRRLKGGCWSVGAVFSRAATRPAHPPQNRSTTTGFRVLLPALSAISIVRGAPPAKDPQRPDSPAR